MITDETINNGDHVKQKWDETMAQLNAYGNKEGEDVPIDAEIKECVTAFNLLGLKTTASCGGHPEDEGLGFPMLQGILENDDKGNLSAHERAQALIDEFNSGRPVTPFTLHLNPLVAEGFRIESIAQQEGERMMEDNEEGYDREKMKVLGLGTQAEFQAFTEFLKSKVFEVQ
jgi:hypothetical protein